jgi:ABC-type Fe3+/spermidine/putrescine transport system ATPase subunit
MSISDRIAVLRDGTLQQFGRPPEIYAAPESPFLANFVGGANFLEGTVVRKTPDATLVELAEGFSIVSPESTHRLGDAAVASFRQERTSILTSASVEENVLPGRLLSTSLLGVFVRCLVDLGRAGQIVAKVPLREALGQRVPDRVGEVVYARASREGILLFRRPARPLAVELEAF